VHRSGAHPYNLSLFGAVTEHLGEAKAEQWLKGLVANMARDPKGGDSDQIKAVASGECGIALTNTYYLARIMRSNAADDKAWPTASAWSSPTRTAGARM
jgi:iron(III) transport system substrate-binding protein